MIGAIGLKVADISGTAEFNGKYFMAVYMIVCVMTFINYFYDRRKIEKA